MNRIIDQADQNITPLEANEDRPKTDRNSLFDETIDLLESLQRRGEQIQVDEVWDGFAVGEVGALVAPGAAGKTYWALQASAALAGGWAADTINLFSPHIQPPAPSGVFYLATEDAIPRLKNRISSLGARLDTSTFKDIARNFRLLPMAGKGLDIGQSPQLDELISRATGARLIVIDTFSKSHQREENSNSEMSQIINGLYRVARETNAAVLYCHHVAKGRVGVTGDQHAARGASALTDGGRWAACMGKLSKDEAARWAYAEDLDGHKKEGDNYHSGDRSNPDAIGPENAHKFSFFETNKQNYGEHRIKQCFRHGKGGVLVPCKLRLNDPEKTRRAGEMEFRG